MRSLWLLIHLKLKQSESQPGHKPWRGRSISDQAAYTNKLFKVRFQKEFVWLLLIKHIQT